MTFDFSPYSFTLDREHTPPWHMDPRHVAMLFAVLEKHRPRKAIEIGSYRGSSTAAFVEALNAGHIDELTCIERHPTPQLHRVLAMVQRGKARVLPRASLECDFRGADIVFIDGDHGWPAIHEVARCLALDIPVIAMHDTQGHYGCGGSALAAAVLREAVGREFTEDAEQRPGEFTHRGFLVSRKI